MFLFWSLSGFCEVNMPTAGRREAKLPHRQRLWVARFLKHGLSRRQRRWRVVADTVVFWLPLSVVTFFFQGQAFVGKLLGRCVYLSIEVLLIMMWSVEGSQTHAKGCHEV